MGFFKNQPEQGAFKGSFLCAPPEGDSLTSQKKVHCLMRYATETGKFLEFESLFVVVVVVLPCSLDLLISIADHLLAYR